MGSSVVAYDAYGQQRVGSNATPFPVRARMGGHGGRFGYYRDSETGLECLGYRYYDPATGRFLTQDPIGFAGGVNLYGYVGGNPVGGADPWGLYHEDFAGYRREVAAVGRGYYQFLGGLRPDRVIRGLADLYHYGEKCGLARTANLAWGGFVSGYTDAFTTSDPEAFGRSMGNWLFSGATAAWIAGGSGARAASGAGAAGGAPPIGTRVGRIFGGDSGPYGHSWAPMDELMGPNPRTSLGLPSGGPSGANNTGQFAVEGLITDNTGITVRAARPLDGNPGGGVEFLIPDPGGQISIIGGGGVNPPF